MKQKLRWISLASTALCYQSFYHLKHYLFINIFTTIPTVICTLAIWYFLVGWLGGFFFSISFLELLVKQEFRLVKIDWNLEAYPYLCLCLWNLYVQIIFVYEALEFQMQLNSHYYCSNVNAGLKYKRLK